MKARYRNATWEVYENGKWVEKTPPSRFASIAESGKPPRMEVGATFAWDQENGGRGHKCEQAPNIYATSKADLKDKLSRAGYTYEE